MNDQISASEKKNELNQRQSKNMVPSTVKDVISKSKTMTGKKPDDIEMNPIKEMVKHILEVYDIIEESINVASGRSVTYNREWGSDSLTNIYKKNTPGQTIDTKFTLKFKDPQKDKEAVSRSGNPARKEMDIVRRNDANADRKTDSAYYRHQSIVKKIIDEATDHKEERLKLINKAAGHNIPSKMRDKIRKAADLHGMAAKDPEKYAAAALAASAELKEETELKEKYGKGYVSPASKIERAMATRGVKPDSSDKYRQEMEKNSAAYKAILDREAAAKKKTNEEVLGCDIDDLTEEELGFTEENFIPSGNELYEDWNELEEEAEYQGRKVKLGKPFLTPGGPKKRSVYVKNEKNNVVKVNFGDPNMTIKKNIPARRKSFRARHHCDTNPGPRTKARYWSCRAW